MIIDAHVHHLWPGGVNRPTAKIERTRRLALALDIRRVLLLGPVTSLPYAPSPEQIRAANTNTIHLMEYDPNFFLGACYLNPAHDPAFIRDETARCVAAGMVAIKLWVAVKASDPRLDRVMKSAEAFNLPVFIHAFYKTTGNLEQESTGADVADLARRFPGSTIVMLHLPGVKYRGVQDIAELPNVFIDTSGCQPESDIVEYAVRHLGPDRIVYGSDAPGRQYATQLGRVLGAKISAEVRQKILWENAAALLGLT